MSATCFEALHPAASHRPGLRARLADVQQFLSTLRARARARRALLAADDRMLADLGISRAQAHFAAQSGRLD